MLQSVCVLAMAACAYGAAPEVTLRERASVRVPGAEIVAPCASDGSVLLTGHGVVRCVRLGEAGVTGVWRRSAREWVPAMGVDASVTHVAVDPLGRGFFVALVAPARSWERTGRVVIAEMATGEAISVHEVGYGPDACAFSPDGSTVIIANEGEAGEPASGAVMDPPGTVSLLRIGDRGTVETRALLPTRDGIEGELRVHPRNTEAVVLDLEPEYIAVMGARAYITLQENNAIAEIDWRSGEVLRVFGLAPTLAVIDADDEDRAAGIHTTIVALPMPDQLAAFEEGERRYLVTANEGDERGGWGESALGDSARVGDLRAAGRVAGHAHLGERLKVCAFSGDADGDGVIERVSLLGARSISVWDARTGARVSDTGSMLETAMSAHPAIYNATGGAGGQADSRSDDRGPEPEGVILGSVGGRRLAFVGLERPGAIAMIDLSEPARPALLGLHPSAAHGRYAPEGLAFVDAADSPFGVPLLVVAYEASGEMVVYEVKISADDTGR